MFQVGCEGALSKALEVAVDDRQHACTSRHTYCSSTTSVRMTHVHMFISAYCLSPQQTMLLAEQICTSILVAQHELPARTKNVLGTQIRLGACGSACWSTHQASRGPSISANWRRPRYKSYLHPQNMLRPTLKCSHPEDCCARCCSIRGAGAAPPPPQVPALAHFTERLPAAVLHRDHAVDQVQRPAHAEEYLRA